MRRVRCLRQNADEADPPDVVARAPRDRREVALHEMAQRAPREIQRAQEVADPRVELLLLGARPHALEQHVPEPLRRAAERERVEQQVAQPRRDRHERRRDLLDVDAALLHRRLELGVRDHLQRVDEQRVRPVHVIEELERLLDVLARLDWVVGDDVVGRRDVVLRRERRVDLTCREDLLRRRRALVELERPAAAALDPHPHPVHPGPRQQLELVALDVVGNHAVDGEREVELGLPELGELLDLAVRDRHEAVVVKGDVAEVREALAGRLDLVDDVACARVADALVGRVVGDELRVAAVGAVKRAADRPQRRVAEAVVVDVVLGVHRLEADAGLVDDLALAVLRERQRLHHLRRHERQEVVLLDLAVGRLEPEVLDVRRVAALDQQLAQLLEGELALARADRIDVGEDRVLGLDDRVDPAPDHERRRIELLDPRDQLAGQVGVAGHRREADDVGVDQAARSEIDVLGLQRAGAAERSAQSVANAAVPVRRDVTGLRVLVDTRGERGHLAKAAGRDPVFQRDELDAHRPASMLGLIRPAIVAVRTNFSRTVSVNLADRAAGTATNVQSAPATVPFDDPSQDAPGRPRRRRRRGGAERRPVDAARHRDALRSARGDARGRDARAAARASPAAAAARRAARAHRALARLVARPHGAPAAPAHRLLGRAGRPRHRRARSRRRRAPPCADPRPAAAPPGARPRRLRRGRRDRPSAQGAVTSRACSASSTGVICVKHIVRSRPKTSVVMPTARTLPSAAGEL